MQENQGGAALSPGELRIAEATAAAEAERAALAHKQAQFLDRIMAAGQIKNDAELSRLIEMSPPVVSKLRNGHMPVGSTILIALNEVTDIPVCELKKQLGYKILPSRAGK